MNIHPQESNRFIVLLKALEERYKINIDMQAGILFCYRVEKFWSSLKNRRQQSSLFKIIDKDRKLYLDFHE